MGVRIINYYLKLLCKKNQKLKKLMRLKKKNFHSVFFFKDLKEKLGVFLSRYNDRKKIKNRGKKTKIFFSEKKKLIDITIEGIKK